MTPAAPFVLLDDAREGAAPARLYTCPHTVLRAGTVAEVAPLLETVRASSADAAGFLAYEAASAFEPRLAGAMGASAGPLAWFGLFDRWEEVDAAAWLPDSAGAWIGAPEPEVDAHRYGEMFGAVQALITAGDLYQANLSFRASVPVAGDALALYARLRRTTRAGWGAVVATGRETIVSLSPELFFALKDGQVTCRPMKGTVRRGDDPVSDAAAVQALAADAKQRAENLMIVDLMRNDLSRVAAPASVAVPALFTVETYPTVHTMTSTITATLAPGCDAVDVLAALFPCGSITGAPKIRAAEALAGIEASARGLYTGAIGYIDRGGDAQFNVAIRTLLLDAAGTLATVGLGGGVVADSTAASEWDEAHAKGAFLTHGGAGFDLIETMRFDPMDGVVDVERHLARMKASATALGFAFDRHAARNELQAATFRARAAMCVRLVLAQSGVIAVEVAPAPAPRDRLWRVGIAPLPVSPADIRLRHKTSARGFYDAARRESGADEVVFVDADGRVTEGSFTSVFVERDGVLLTPPAMLPLLPGVLRARLLEEGRAQESVLTTADLARGFLLGNALRDLIPAVLAVAE